MLERRSEGRGHGQRVKARQFVWNNVITTVMRQKAGVTSRRYAHSTLTCRKKRVGSGPPEIRRVYEGGWDAKVERGRSICSSYLRVFLDRFKSDNVRVQRLQPRAICRKYTNMSARFVPTELSPAARISIEVLLSSTA